MNLKDRYRRAKTVTRDKKRLTIITGCHRIRSEREIPVLRGCARGASQFCERARAFAPEGKTEDGFSSPRAIPHRWHKGTGIGHGFGVFAPFGDGAFLGGVCPQVPLRLRRGGHLGLVHSSRGIGTSQRGGAVVFLSAIHIGPLRGPFSAAPFPRPVFGGAFSAARFPRPVFRGPLSGVSAISSAFLSRYEGSRGHHLPGGTDKVGEVGCSSMMRPFA